MDTVLVVLRVALSLGVVVALLWYVQRRILRGRAGRPANPLQVRGRQGVGAKAQVVVVDLDGQRFLLGVTEQSVNLLHTSEAPEEPAGNVADFSEKLERAQREQGAIVPPALPQGGALHGSILAASTWRQAARAIKQLR